MPATRAPELSVVMPVRNEEGSVGGVVHEWIAELDRLALDYRICVYDDGSSDGTPVILDRLAADNARVRVQHHANEGHGPTILRGYREAEGDWVFQADSDGEIAAASFAALWEARGDHDFVVGRREDRRSPPGRRVITTVSRLAVRTLFGPGIRDVNSPFRLMRRARLQALLGQLPPAPFAPNIILSGLAIRTGLRVREVPVPHVGRRRGRSGLGGGHLWRMAARALRETIGTAMGTRRGA